MGLFSKLFGKPKSIKYGDEAGRLVQSFLNSSANLKFSAFTFTELFAFVYFEIDSVLYARKSSARQSIATSLSTSFLNILGSQFKNQNESAILEMLNSRIMEYGAMTRAHKEKSDMVEKLDFYLTQASKKGAFLQGTSSPIVLTGAFESLTARSELTQFYIAVLAPFVKSLLSKVG
jgi:hypothetical protein